MLIVMIRRESGHQRNLLPSLTSSQYSISCQPQAISVSQFLYFRLYSSAIESVPQRLVHEGIRFPLVEVSSSTKLPHQFSCTASSRRFASGRLPDPFSPVVALFQHDSWNPAFRSWLGLVLLPEDAVGVGDQREESF